MQRVVLNFQSTIELFGDDLNNKNFQKELENYLSKKFGVLDLNISSFQKTKLAPDYLAELDYDTVIKAITNDPSYKEFKVKNKKYTVRMNSHRYFLFRENNVCVSCGLQGDRFVLEKPAGDAKPHFNLYGVENDSYVLMTKDHVFPKCLGGKDHHSNYQTMCSVCNGLKGHDQIPVHVIRQLRNFLNENKLKITRKQLYASLESIKHNYFSNIQNKSKSSKYNRLHGKKKTGSIVACSDLCVIDKNDSFEAINIYENKKDNHIACIKRNTILTPILTVDNKYICVINKNINFEICKKYVRDI